LKKTEAVGGCKVERGLRRGGSPFNNKVYIKLRSTIIVDQSPGKLVDRKTGKNKRKRVITGLPGGTAILKN